MQPARPPHPSGDSPMEGSESAVVHAFDLTGIAMALIGSDGRILRTSRGLRRRLNTDADLAGQDCHDLVDPRDHDRLLSMLDLVSRGVVTEPRFRMRWVPMEGAPRSTLVCFSLTLDAERSPSAFMRVLSHEPDWCGEGA